VVTFVCSIGNVPLAAVLWNGGISFGGVISFIFADLIIIPLLLIYRKYYGTRMALFLFTTFYVTMVAAGFVIELVFAPLGLVPTGARHANVGAAGISWNYTSFLNIAFLVLAAVLIVRFLRTGGRAMLAMMGGGPDEMTDQGDSSDHIAPDRDGGGVGSAGDPVPSRHPEASSHASAQGTGAGARPLATTPMRTSLAGPRSVPRQRTAGSNGGSPSVGRSSPAGTRRPAGCALPNPALSPTRSFRRPTRCSMVRAVLRPTRRPSCRPRCLPHAASCRWPPPAP
jgi:hypothetical protein